MGSLSFHKLTLKPFFFPYLEVDFNAESEQGVAQAILRGLIDFKREPWPSISESAKSLVRQMLEPDPKLRLTAKQVLGMFYLLLYHLHLTLSNTESIRIPISYLFCMLFSS